MGRPGHGVRVLRPAAGEAADGAAPEQQRTLRHARNNAHQKRHFAHKGVRRDGAGKLPHADGRRRRYLEGRCCEKSTYCCSILISRLHSLLLFDPSIPPRTWLLNPLLTPAAERASGLGAAGVILNLDHMMWKKYDALSDTHQQPTTAQETIIVWEDIQGKDFALSLERTEDAKHLYDVLRNNVPGQDQVGNPIGAVSYRSRNETETHGHVHGLRRCCFRSAGSDSVCSSSLLGGVVYHSLISLLYFSFCSTQLRESRSVKRGRPCHFGAAALQEAKDPSGKPHPWHSGQCKRDCVELRDKFPRPPATRAAGLPQHGTATSAALRSRD